MYGGARGIFIETIRISSSFLHIEGAEGHEERRENDGGVRGNGGISFAIGCLLESDEGKKLVLGEILSIRSGEEECVAI